MRPSQNQRTLLVGVICEKLREIFGQPGVKDWWTLEKVGKGHLPHE